jgi:hypothetical protein
MTGPVFRLRLRVRVGTGQGGPSGLGVPSGFVGATLDRDSEPHEGLSESLAARSQLGATPVTGPARPAAPGGPAAPLAAGWRPGALSTALRRLGKPGPAGQPRPHEARPWDSDILSPPLHTTQWPAQSPGPGA